MSDPAKILASELIQDSQCDTSMANGIRMVRVFIVSVSTEDAWQDPAQSGALLASGNGTPASWRTLEASLTNNIPKIYDKYSYFPSGTGSGMPKYELVCTRVWTSTESDKKIKVYSEWMSNSGTPLLVDSGFVQQSEGMLSLVQYNHDKFGGAIKVLYVPPGKTEAECLNTLPWHQAVLLDKQRAYLTRSYTGIASQDPYEKSQNILGSVDETTRTQLCTSFVWKKRPDGKYDVKLMFAEDLDGWDRIKVWTDQYGKVPVDIADNMGDITGFEHGPLPEEGGGGSITESSGVKINGAFRPNMYETFKVIKTGESGAESDFNLPYQIADQFPLPVIGA